MKVKYRFTEAELMARTLFIFYLQSQVSFEKNQKISTSQKESILDQQIKKYKFSLLKKNPEYRISNLHMKIHVI